MKSWTKIYVNELHSSYDLFDIDIHNYCNMDNYVIDYANVHYELHLKFIYNP